VVVGGAIGAMIGLPSLVYLLSPGLKVEEDDAWVDLGPLEEFPEKVPTLFEFTRTRVSGWERTAIAYGAYVVRPDASRVWVVSDICTHLGCRVSWHPDRQHYISPCHDGHFDIAGLNVSGPPPRPLDDFRTRVQEGHLYIALPAIRRAS
jgi:menaquinol-cytochrome c reductase iron-sulfur subunit